MSTTNPRVPFRESVLDLDDLQVGVHESPGDGPTFVLVHGIGVSAGYFRPLSEQLVGCGRVVALDLPGSGETRRPRRNLTVPDFAQCVLRVVADLGLADPVVLGHSMGAQVVVEALAQAPDLSPGAVLASPVVNCEERSTGRILRRFLQSARYEPWGSAWEAIRAYASSGPIWLVRTWPAMTGFRIEDRIGDVACDLTLVGGDKDTLCPRYWLDHLATRTRRPDQTEVHYLPGAAHQVTWSHPQLCCREMVEMAERVG